MEEEKEMLELTNETENDDTQASEELEGGIELTDTTETESTEEVKTEEEPEEEKEEVKTFTQDEVDEIVKRRLARKEREYQKELSKYKDTDNVLRSTLNIQEGDDTNAKLREYYEAEGIKLPKAIEPGLSSREIEILGREDAEEIIAEGYDAMVTEANRLANIGYNNLNDREKVIFTTLGDKLTEEKDKKELRRLGAKDELLTDSEFSSFRKQFNSDVPMETIYSLYTKNNKKETAKSNPGSMKNNDVNSPKDFYTEEEIGKLTDEQLDDPKIWEAVRNSMTKTHNSNF